MHTTVTAFPLSRQQKLLRGIADVLRSKQGVEATLFWRETAKGLMQNLTERGVDAQSAEDEVRALFYAVMAEIDTDAQVRRG
ncbi:MAG: hypothetical protein J0H60_09715 [Rhizobiales bacterium]|nr:hypothetical protein [Hyphomicrobiales bacterium]